MLKVIEYEGDYYNNKVKGNVLSRRDYIRFEWDTGTLDMRMSEWGKLSQKKKNLIYKMASKSSSKKGVN